MAIPSYWRSIPQRYRYEAGKCQQCGKIFFPPRLICDECKSQEFSTTGLNREGTIVTHTAIRVAPPAFAQQAPYTIAIVAMDDGAHLCMQVTDCNVDDVSIGMRVKIEFRKISEDGDAGIIHYGYKAVPLMEE